MLPLSLCAYPGIELPERITQNMDGLVCDEKENTGVGIFYTRMKFEIFVIIVHYLELFDAL